jgi:PST family polysaccharide transporter
MRDAPEPIIPADRVAIRRGALWTGTSLASQKVLGLLATLVLARILFPADFGTFAMAAIAFHLVALFDGLGTGAFVVYRKDVRGHLDTAFTLQMAGSVLLALVLLVTAPLVAMYFRRPVVAPLLAFLALTLPIGGIGAVHAALLDRELRFAETARRRIVVDLVGPVVSVLLALLGAGVWSLVVPYPLRAAVDAWLNWRLHPWRPGRATLRGAREILAYGGSVLGSRGSEYGVAQLDSVLAGRFFGAAALGLYDFAYNSAMAPVRILGDLVSRVGFPVMAKEMGEREGDVRALHDATRWAFLFALPLTIGQTFLAREWVLTLYGARWEGAVPLFRILVLGTLPVVLARPAVLWMRAAGRPEVPFRVSIAALPLFAGILVLCRPLGLASFAGAVAAFLALLNLALVRTALRLSGVGVSEWARSLSPGLIPCCILLGVLLLLGTLTQNALPAPLPRLLLLVPAGGLAWTAALFAFSRRDFRKLVRVPW